MLSKDWKCLRVKFAVREVKEDVLTFCRLGDSIDVSGKVLLCEKPVVQVKSLRCLGFHIDSNLSWKHHSGIISAKIARGVGIWMYCTWSQKTEAHSARTYSSPIYFAIIYPYIPYGCVVWSRSFYINYKRFQILQNISSRIFRKYVKNVKDSSVCFKSLKATQCWTDKDYQAAMFVFNCVHNLLPGIFNEFFHFRSSVHEHDTRWCDNLVWRLKIM